MAVEVINDLLGYEGLKIIQRPDAFNFSLDSTLLADFVTINKNDKMIMDMGCGNGYIPIFLSLRVQKDAHIYGVEIQKDIYDLAYRSVKLNNLENQITIVNQDLKTLHNDFGICKFDVITCNPPYFKYKETSNINKNDYLTIARHEVMVNLDEVVKEASLLLKEGGTFAMVHRSERFTDILFTFRKYKIEPKRLRFVYPKRDSDSLIVLIEGKKSLNEGGLKVLKPMYIYNKDNSYTKEVLKIFNYQKK